MMTGMQDVAEMRMAMVASQLRPNAVSDMRVIDAMAVVPREKFVNAASSSLAYRDTAVPIAPGRALNPPMVLGRLLTEAQVPSGARVLVIGAGTGYAAAVLAAMGAHVTALEENAALAEHAAVALAGISAVTLVRGSLAKGWPTGAPYDLVLIDGAVEHVPEAIVAQLGQGGRIATGRLDRGVTRLAIGRRSAGGFGLIDFADAECVVLPGFAVPRQFVF